MRRRLRCFLSASEDVRYRTNGLTASDVADGQQMNAKQRFRSRVAGHTKTVGYLRDPELGP